MYNILITDDEKDIVSALKIDGDLFKAILKFKIF